MAQGPMQFHHFWRYDFHFQFTPHSLYILICEFKCESYKYASRVNWCFEKNFLIDDSLSRVFLTIVPEYNPTIRKRFDMLGAVTDKVCLFVWMFVTYFDILGAKQLLLLVYNTLNRGWLRGIKGHIWQFIVRVLKSRLRYID